MSPSGPAMYPSRDMVTEYRTLPTCIPSDLMESLGDGFRAPATPSAVPDLGDPRRDPRRLRAPGLRRGRPCGGVEHVLADRGLASGIRRHDRDPRHHAGHL